jgi:hypothetical protein
MEQVVVPWTFRLSILVSYSVAKNSVNYLINCTIKYFRSVIITYYDPGVDSASNRKEYEESYGGGGERPHKADYHTANGEPIVWQMWEPLPLTTVWAPTACYRDSFTFYLIPYWIYKKKI